MGAATAAALVVAGAVAVPAGAASDTDRWVLQNDRGELTERFGSRDAVLVTGVPRRSPGEYIPASAVFVTEDVDWSGRDGEVLVDVSNPEGVPNVVVGFEVVEQPVYLPTLRTGGYDVVFDNDEDGVFTEGFDDVLGADEHPAFTVFFDGSVSATDKQRLKEQFAAPLRQAAARAVAISGVVSAVTASDDVGGYGGVAGSYLEGQGQSVAYRLTTSGPLLLQGIDLASGRGRAVDHSVGQLRKTAAALVDAVAAIEADPPDPDYERVADVEPVDGQGYDATTGEPLYDAAAQLSNRSDEATALLRALLHDVERYDGAGLDDARPAMRRQAVAMAERARLARGVLTAALASAGEVADLLRNAAAELSVDEVQQQRLLAAAHRLQTEGFSASEQALLSDAGVDPALAEELRQHLVSTFRLDELPPDLPAALTAVSGVREDVVAGLWDLETQAANLVDEIDRLADSGGPQATDDALTVEEGASATVEVLANDSGTGLVLTATTAPARGQAWCDGAGLCTYEAPAAGTGADDFTYTVQDAQGRTATAAVRVEVLSRGENGPPVAGDDWLTVPQERDGALYVLGNDGDPDGDVLTTSLAVPPVHGTASCWDWGWCEYRPAPGFSGDDAFSYRLEDGRGGEATAVVHVTVLPNASPVARDDAASTAQDTAVVVDVLLNDDDPDGDRLAVAGATAPAHGTVGCGDRTCEYRPEPGWTGSDAFVYRVVDDRGGSAEARVDVVVRPNAAPVAAADRLPLLAGSTSGVDVLANDEDADGHVLTVTSWTAPERGSVDCAPTGRCRYTAPPDASGPDAFSYTVADGRGGEASATVAVDVRPRTGTTTSQGSHFWLAFPTNYGAGTADEYRLYVSGAAPASGLVEVPGLGFTATFDVRPGEVTTVDLPSSVELDESVDGVQDRGVRVMTTSPVSVYGMSRQQYTTDAFLALPTEVAGTEHVAMAWGPAQHGGSTAAVVATEDLTTVTVSPSADAGADRRDPYEVQLDAGEVHQLVGYGDVTGTVVTADRPVHLLGGNACANIPSPSVGYCDHVVEMQAPTSGWGRQFVTVPLAGRTGGDTYRVLAAEDGTTVSVDGGEPVRLDRGEHEQLLLTEPATITSDRPVLLAQYANGTEFDGVVSDPFMMIVPPYEQFLDAYTVTTPATGFRANYLNLAVPDSAVGAVTVDGQAVPAASFRPIGSTGFSAVQHEVAPGSHVLAGPQPFGVFVYGFDDYDSYGYTGGTSLSQVARATAVALDPARQEVAVGDEACLDALVTDQHGGPVAGVRVTFDRSGAHDGRTTVETGADGAARTCLTGSRSGTDTVVASLGTLRASAEVLWSAPSPTVLEAEPAVARVAVPGAEVFAPELVARLSTSTGPLAGRTVVMRTGGQEVCRATSDEGGTARCGTPTGLVATVLARGWSAHFDGDAGHLPSTAQGGLVQVRLDAAGAARTAPPAGALLPLPVRLP